MATGATWLVMIWTTSDLQFAPAYAPQVIGAAIIGLTLSRALDRRMHAMLLSAAVTAGWIALQIVAFQIHDAPPRWNAFATSSFASYGVIALVAIPVAALAALPRLRGRADHPLLWLWISALVMLGTILLPVMLISNDQKLAATAAILMFFAPVATGAITQILAPYRAIWTCGGAAVIFFLILVDEGFSKVEPGEVLGSILGVGMFALLGALGARIGWRAFRNKDPRTPVRADLPTATAS